MYDSSVSIEEFLMATAARTPTPGGGSVAALVGALAAALGEMVVNYSLKKKGLEAYEAELRPVLEELRRAREMLKELMVEDQAAYQALTTAKKLPTDSAERDGKIAAALLVCIRVPQSIAATAVGILERCDRLVNFVNYYLLSDLAVCADLSMATIRCAIYSVRSNLKEVSDPEDRRSIEETVRQVLARALTLIQNVAPRVWERDSQGA